MKIIAIDYNDNDKETLKQMVKNGHTVYTKKEGQYLSLFVDDTGLNGNRISDEQVYDLLEINKITVHSTPCNVTGCPTSDDLILLRQSISEQERRLVEVENVLSKPLLAKGG